MSQVATELGNNSNYLTKEEIARLFAIYKNPNSTKEERDEASVTLFYSVEKYLIGIARKRFPTYYEREKDDMYGICQECFFSKIGDYDPSAGALTTYFKPHIIHELQEFVNKSSNLSAHYSQNIKKIKKVIKECEEKDEKWDALTLQARTDLPLSTIQTCLNMMQMSSDIHISSSEFTEQNLLIFAESPEEMMIKATEIKSIHRAIDSLTTEEKKVICMCFGIGFDKPFSMPKVASETGVDIVRVKRIRNAAMRKLKKSIEREGLFKNKVIKREIETVNEEITFIPSGHESLRRFEKDMEDADIDF